MELKLRANGDRRSTGLVDKGVSWWNDCMGFHSVSMWVSFVADHVIAFHLCFICSLVISVRTLPFLWHSNLKESGTYIWALFLVSKRQLYIFLITFFCCILTKSKARESFKSNTKELRFNIVFPFHMWRWHGKPTRCLHHTSGALSRPGQVEWRAEP